MIFVFLRIIRESLSKRCSGCVWFVSLKLFLVFEVQLNQIV